MAWRKPWLQNLLLISGSILFGLAFLEIALRLLGISYPSFYTADAQLGHALRPGATGWWRKEGEAFIRINQDGLRDRHYAKVKPNNTLRIAILGDSYAEALQVPAEQAFWSIVEQQLGKCKTLQGQDVDVINFGVSGYGTAQELLMLRHRVWDYNPDLILLTFLAGNDIRNNSRALEQDEMRPYFVRSDDGRLVLDNSFQTSKNYLRRQSWHWQLAYQLINYSHILQLLNEAKNVRQTRLAQERQAAKNTQSSPSQTTDAETKTQASSSEPLTATAPDPTPGLDSGIYRPPTTPEWQEAWQVTEALLRQMNQEIISRGADFFVVTLTNGSEVVPDPDARASLKQTFGVNHLFYADRRIAALGKQAGFPVLNLAKPFQVYADKHRTCLHGFENASACSGHWNVEGHRLAGEIISEQLCQAVAARKKLPDVLHQEREG